VDVLIERCAGIDVGKDEVVACVRTPGPSGRGTAQADPDVRLVHRGAGGDGRLVPRRGCHRDRDGGDRPVLEAGLVRARRPALRGVAAGHQPPREDPARSQERRARRRVAGRAARARAAAQQLRAPVGHSPAAGSDPLSQAADPGAHRRGPTDRQDPRGRGDQAGLGRRRGAWCLRPGDADRPDRRRTRSRGAGRPGPREAAHQDPGAAPGIARPVRRAPRAADRAVAEAHRAAGGRDRRTGPAHRHPVRHRHQRGRRSFRPGP
jgi:hypothetical protein